MSSSSLLALLVALAGGIGGFAGAGLSAWVAHRSQDRSHRRDQQRKDAEAIGPVLDYLVDSDPQRLAMNASPDLDEQSQLLAALKNRRDHLRAGLLVMAAGHPDPVVRERARELSVALYNALTSAAWAVRDIHNSFSGGHDSVAVAKGDHESAQTLAEKLLQESTRHGNA